VDATLTLMRDQIIGTLVYSGVRVATGTMAYNYEALNVEEIKWQTEGSNFNLKIIPSVDDLVALMQLIRYQMTDVKVKWAWRGPAALDIHPCALTPLHKFPVREVIGGVHYLTDLTLPYGEVVYDYLKES
jgi:acetoacetate decarboxylase